MVPTEEGCGSVCVYVCGRLDIGLSPTGHGLQEITSNRTWHGRRRGAILYTGTAAKQHSNTATRQKEVMGVTGTDRPDDLRFHVFE